MYPMYFYVLNFNNKTSCIRFLHFNGFAFIFRLEVKRIQNPKITPKRMSGKNPFENLLTSLEINGTEHKFYNLQELGEKYKKLPFSIKVLLESAVRNCDEFQILSSDVDKILNWSESQAKGESVEVPFLPSRVVLQDFTGVPAVVDFAAMRDAVKALGGNPENINPTCPSDLVIDHSVQVDVSRTSDSKAKVSIGNFSLLIGIFH